MEQAELRSWEARCTQEEPPRCRAACPLHVDVREFCTRMAYGKVDQAWATLCRSLPLPSVMARICDAPCKNACLRGEASGAVEVGALERACADGASRTPVLPVPPSKGRTATVFGGDMAALAAVWDLSRKGVEVVLYCHCSAAELPVHLYGHVAPELAADLQQHFEKELGTLNRQGVVLHEQAALSADMVDAAMAEGRSVFIAPDVYHLLHGGDVPPDQVTLGTVRSGVFAAMPLSGPASPVKLAALGRRAAISMDRLFQNASLAAGREREGVFETRLFTNIAKVAPEPPVPVPAEGYSPAQATEEAARCLQCECMECVKNCAYLAEYGSYPKQYTRRIYNNESIVMGTRQANTMINSCMMCGLCASLCPEGFDMGALCLQSRQGMVKRGKMPSSAHEFALRDMQFANGDDCVIASHAPGTAASAWLFFPGCQLTASMPDAVERTWQWLRESLPADKGGVGLLLHCCGAPAHWAGRPDMHAAVVEEVRGRWEKLGSPPIIAACPTCTDMLRKAMPQAVITTLWEVLADTLSVSSNDTGSGNATLPASPVPHGTELVLHDPCNTRHDAALRSAVRTLLAKRSITVREPELTGEHTECCGFGGLSESANPDLGRKIRDGRAARLSAASGDGPVADAVTYCAMCRDMLAKSGKRIMHLLDLLLPPAEPQERVCCGTRQAELPYAGPAPSYSERRENRIRLRERLVPVCQGETARTPAPWENVRVSYTDEARKTMESRRILDSDVRRVLFHMEQGGSWLENVSDSASKGRRLAMFRPTIVTYWVEFTLEGDGAYRVHNTWCHRMRIFPSKQGAA